MASHRRRAHDRVDAGGAARALGLASTRSPRSGPGRRRAGPAARLGTSFTAWMRKASCAPTRLGVTSRRSHSLGAALRFDLSRGLIATLGFVADDLQACLT